MNLIKETGTFRGISVDSGVAESKGGFPQFVINLRATEYFDEQEQQWVDWAEQNEEIIAYMVLFGGDSTATLTAKQIQKVFGWS